MYFSAAASFFAPVQVVGVVGNDFDLSRLEFLKSRQVDFSGLKVEKGATFRWGGRYKRDMNRRDTLFTYLNVFEKFSPEIPEHYRQTEFVFLANIDPELQLQVLNTLHKPRLSVLDTMNFWISGKRQGLEEVIRRVDILIVNDEEIRELTGKLNVYEAAHQLLEKGIHALVIKKGEHGAVLVTPESYFFCPAYPVKKVVDPTGAGDSFAGGFLGYLASVQEINEKQLRRAVIYGCTVASFTVEDFSFQRLQSISHQQLQHRVKEMEAMLQF